MTDRFQPIRDELRRYPELPRFTLSRGTVTDLVEALATTEAALAESRGEVERLKERQHERTEVFGECISDYERLRGYVNRRYGDTLTQREVNVWMGDNGYGLFVEGVPESDAWRDRYWRDLLQDAGTDESHA